MRLKAAGDSDRSLSTAEDPASLIQDATLNDLTVGIGEGDRRCEIEIAARLDQCEVHAGRNWIRHDPLDLGDGEIAAGVSHLAGLIIDDPVTKTRLGAAEVLGRKLVTFCRCVIVDRIKTVDENAECHRRSLARC